MKLKTYSSVGAETPDLLTDEEAANLVAVEPRTIRLWRTRRGLPHLKLTSKVVRIRRRDFDDWLSRHRVTISA